jgi:hypothetical protein
MEGPGRPRERTLKRCYQCSRLEEQLWATAYEQVSPVIRRALAGHRKDEARHFGQQTSSAIHIARRA